jgi:hypothetical protein
MYSIIFFLPRDDSFLPRLAKLRVDMEDVLCSINDAPLPMVHRIENQSVQLPSFKYGLFTLLP